MQTVKRLYFEYDFPNWNKYINAERSNRFMASKIKRQEKDFVSWILAKEPPYSGNYPVELTIRPHFKAKRQDLDNFRYKGLLDGIVAAGIIKNDNLTCITKITLEAVFDNQVGVEVEIKESEQ